MKIFNYFTSPIIFNKKRDSFRNFMLNEINKYNQNYAFKKVNIKNPESILKNKIKGGVITFLHFGGFFLSGIALIEILKIKYTAVASKNNLKFLTKEESEFWQSVHEKMSSLYSKELFFTNESPHNLIRWLNQDGYLGVAMDVIEEGRTNKLSAFKFLNQNIYLQTGPARLARITNKPLISMTIRYSPLLRKHSIVLGEPKYVENEIISTQDVLNEMELQIKGFEYQFFHDILNLFKLENTNK